MTATSVAYMEGSITVEKGGPAFCAEPRQATIYWTDFISTVTGTPFVSTSKTAERARA